MYLKGNVLRVELPQKIIEIFCGKARYRAAYGGRGSGKTRSFAIMSVLRAIQLSELGKSGLIVCAREYMNSVGNSMQAEIAAIIEDNEYLRSYFDLSENIIRTKDKRISFVFIGLNRNLSSIKSMANIHIFWVDEAENVSSEAWLQVVPTVREEDSEIWATWNPCSKHSEVHKRFRKNESNAELIQLKITELNWQDNPWFPIVLDIERRNDMQFRPEHYGHIWEGEFRQIISGAYFADCLLKAKQEGRVSYVAADPLMTYQSFWDIGGAGAKADATAIWIVQFIGQEIRVINYYEAKGQPLAAHIDWLRNQGYGNCIVHLPHDGRNSDRVHRVSFESALLDAGFNVEVTPNQGAGAARARIESVRRIFPRIWFDKKNTEAGLEALYWYHERKDEIRNIGLGPEHDWSSHAADAFGLMCIVAMQDMGKQIIGNRYTGATSGGTWMSS